MQEPLKNLRLDTD